MTNDKAMPDTGIDVRFILRPNPPERLVCEAEIIFAGGLLGGMKLVGFSLWRSPDGVVYVTFPSRAFGAGSERRYFDYLRPVDGGSGRASELKKYILELWAKAPVENEQLAIQED